MRMLREPARESACAGRALAWAGRAGLLAWPLERASALLCAIGRQVVLARVGELLIVTFGVLAGVGAFLGFGWMALVWVGQGLPANALVGLGLRGALGIVAGSWLAGLALDRHLLRARPLEALRRPTFVSWGGLAGALLVLAGFATHSPIGGLLLLDGFARGAPLGHALGRIGCLTYGCCHGRRTRGRLAITYTHPQAKAVRLAGLQGVPLHPAPLYEALLDLALFLALNGVAAFGAPQGVPAALALVGYGLGRFVVEFSRDNRGRMLPAGLALNQLLSLGLAALGVAGLPLLLRLGAEAPPFAWAAAAAAAPGFSLSLLPCAVLIGLGFSLHRGRVGSW
jgi:phosphatidylglycerol:prolipoprotein diacylglycerol transferase